MIKGQQRDEGVIDPEAIPDGDPTWEELDELDAGIEDAMPEAAAVSCRDMGRR